ncbi:TniB family NTP-binding protein [Vibrio alginolyticus]|uniref:TniB family NTP-binding protein n=1 Tax=Vibrio alginolyticus TaxID=663 RepID=UPI003218D6BC
MTAPELKPETKLFNSVVCEHVAYVEAFNTVQRLHRYQGQVKAALLLGDYGCGKSFFCKQYANKFSVPPSEEISPVPVLYAEIQPGTKTGGLVGGMLESLGDPVPYSGTVANRGNRLLKLMHELKVSLVILDEVQELLPSYVNKESAPIVRQIKWLMNKSKVPFVLCGHNEAKSLHSDNSQLRSRIQSVIKFSNFSCLNEDAQFDFADYMQGLFDVFPRKLHSSLAVLEQDKSGDFYLKEDISNLLRFCLATRGVPRYINSLLTNIIEETEPGELITNAHFAASWQTVLIDSNGYRKTPKNPFTMSVSSVKSALRDASLYPKSKGQVYD